MSPTTQPSGTYDDLVGTLLDLITPLRDLQRQKAAAYIPIVQKLITSRARNESKIEHILDHLLDCACLPEGLAGFKSLCRHYWPINPHATAWYIQAYRDMWDSEDAPQQGAGS